METALRRIADMLGAFADAVAAWFATGTWRPEAWPGITWALVAALVVLSWLLVWRRRTPRALDVRPPQLLVTSGEVVPDGAEEVGGRRPRRRRVDPSVHATAGAFVMTVSNLSRYPVQLLEVALRDDRRGAPRVASVDAVVPAMGSVSVSGRVALGLRGDGWLDLYCYAAAPRVKVHRHRVELVWEPWAARFKAAPLEQVSAPARRLASDEPDARFLEDDALEHVGQEHAEPERTAPPERAAAPKLAAPEAAAPEAAAPDRAPMPIAPVPAARVPDAPVPAAPVPRTPRPAAGAVAGETKVPPPTPVPASPSPAKSAPASPSPAKPSPANPSPAKPSPRARTAPVAANGAPRDAERAPDAERTPDAERRAVPRIATPPVGVAIAGRGGESARTPDGLPIGRPTARPPHAPAATEPEAVPSSPGAVPASPESGAAPASPEPDEPNPTAATPVRDDAPRSDPPARRRPRLEFPDEF